MSKRADHFERKPRDFYPTPPQAVLPLLPHLKPGMVYDEPCCGDGALIDALTTHGILCTRWSDVEPTGWCKDTARVSNAMELSDCSGDMFITNPPWERSILHPLLVHLSDIAPTWLLLDADWMHTRQAAPYMVRCSRIVSVGRLKWIADSKHTGKDNVVWMLFDGNDTFRHAEFYGRAVSV